MAITRLGFDGVIKAESKLKKKSIALGFIALVKNPVRNAAKEDIVRKCSWLSAIFWVCFLTSYPFIPMYIR